MNSRNLPGTDFLDLPQAVSVASPGDTLLVHSGYYSGFTCTKGLKMLIPPGDSLQFSGPVIFKNIPANQRLDMKGIDDWIYVQHLVLEDIDGQVCIEQCDWGKNIIITRCRKY